MAEYLELYIDQGADFYTTINLYDDNTNTPQNVQGLVITSSMRKSLVSPNTSANLVCSVTDVNNAEITLSLAGSISANLRPGSYLYDVKVYNSNLDYPVTRLIEGVIFVIPSITK